MYIGCYHRDVYLYNIGTRIGLSKTKNKTKTKNTQQNQTLAPFF